MESLSLNKFEICDRHKTVNILLYRFFGGGSQANQSATEIEGPAPMDAGIGRQWKARHRR